MDFSVYHRNWYQNRQGFFTLLWRRLHLDPYIFITLLVLIGISILGSYSINQNDTAQFAAQVSKLFLGFFIMLIIAQISPIKLYNLALWAYVINVFLLVLVLFVGTLIQGARRWISIGISFQPSELMKIILPLLLAYYYGRNNMRVSKFSLLIGCLLIAIPAFLIFKQPDLGTMLLVVFASLSVIWFAGIPIRYLFYIFLILIMLGLVCWPIMTNYQHQVVLNYIEQYSDLLNANHQALTSYTEFGSSALWGAGLFNQVHIKIRFIQEFILGAIINRYGIIMGVVIICAYLTLTLRSFYLALKANTYAGYLFISAFAFNIFIAFFINASMAMGLLPVVGVPLAILSNGGTCTFMMFASFGVLFAINSQRFTN